MREFKISKLLNKRRVSICKWESLLRKICSDKKTNFKIKMKNLERSTKFKALKIERVQMKAFANIETQTLTIYHQ